MYTDFYSLTAEPFRLSPDPRFCYEHPTYTKARAYMRYALDRGEGFVLVTGKPGTGKTTLIENLLADLGDAPITVARLMTTQLQGEDLLRMVCYAIGGDAQGVDKATLLRRVENELLDQAKRNRPVLLIVDEAQNLSEEALEELRLLTNFQAGQNALLQIFLVGQEPLLRLIGRPGMDQLKQRIVAACHLEPLTLRETREYLSHRLECAGWSGDPTISAEVVRLIHAASLGIPRRINIAADRLLLHGFAEAKHELGETDGREVLTELREEHLLEPEEGVPPTEELFSQTDELASLTPGGVPEPEKQHQEAGVSGAIDNPGPPSARPGGR